MTLIFRLSVIMLCFGAKLQKLESLNLDFWVFNFDTIKLILYAEML